MPGHIIVVGSINMDLVVRAKRHPQPGETLLGSDFQTFPGGKGANQAVAAARMGGKVKMIGRVGEDAFGDSLLATLQQNGVDTQHVLRTEETATGVALITLNEAGQNTIVVAPGANAKLTPQDIQAAQAVFEGASVILLQLEIPLETVEAAIDLARYHAVGVVLNPAPAQQLPASLLKKVDFLIPNESELGLLTGMQTVSLAANSLKSIGTRRLVVTLGSQGVLVMEDDDPVYIEPYTVPVVDTVAAGDAFVGAFSVALTERRSTLDAAKWGNAAGALAVTESGAQPSLPLRARVKEFMTSHPPVIRKKE